MFNRVLFAGLQADDVVIVHVQTAQLEEETRKTIEAEVKEAFPNNRVLVLRPQVDLEFARKVVDSTQAALSSTALPS